MALKRFSSSSREQAEYWLEANGFTQDSRTKLWTNDAGAHAVLNLIRGTWQAGFQAAPAPAGSPASTTPPAAADPPPGTPLGQYEQGWNDAINAMIQHMAGLRK